MQWGAGRSLYDMARGVSVHATVHVHVTGHSRRLRYLKDTHVNFGHVIPGLNWQ